MNIKFEAGSLHKYTSAGKIGTAEISHDTPSPMDRMSGAMHGMPLNCEKYTRLLINGSIWMTDAEFEYRTNASHVNKMTGDVLIAGLGIGFIILPILDRENIKSVTVIENNADVIALVSKYLQHPKLNIIHQDIYEWNPPKKSFDYIYFDIWPNVPNEDDWGDMKALKRKYRPALRAGGHIAAWCEDRAKGR